MKSPHLLAVLVPTIVMVVAIATARPRESVPLAMPAPAAAQEPKTLRLWVLFENGYEKDFGYVTGLKDVGCWVTFTDSQGRKFELHRSGDGSTVVGYGTR